MSSPSFQVRPEIAVSVRHPPSYMAKSQVHSSDEDISPTPHSQVRTFGLTREDVTLPEPSGNVWRHFWLSQW